MVARAFGKDVVLSFQDWCFKERYLFEEANDVGVCGAAKTTRF